MELQLSHVLTEFTAESVQKPLPKALVPTRREISPELLLPARIAFLERAHGLSGWKEDRILQMDMTMQIFLQLAEPCEERAIGIASVRRR